LLAAVRAGATLVLLESFNRARVMQRLIDERVTVFPGVPVMFGVLASSALIARAPLQSLRLAFSAGAPLPRDVFVAFRRKFGVPVRQLYGSTEVGAVSINLGPCSGKLWASVGTPIRAVEVGVVDANGRRLGAGQTGEVVIRSPAMASGYDHEESGALAFRDGFYWSGDLGHFDSQGNLYITGRTRLFIDTGGHKVDPVQVERVLNRHPKLVASAVVGVKGRFGRQLVKAVVVAREPCSADEIARWCRGKLADFKVPRVIEFRREIPTGPLGKVLRKYLHDSV
jgi:long-chain acyl-CoA synthetase